MSMDPVFPLPEPDFLWVHDLTFVHHNPDDVEVDANTGNWNYGTSASVTFTGYITAPNPREIDRAASRGIVLDAVALAPRDLAVDDLEAATLLATASTISRWLQGRYTVNTIRPNPSHLRLLLTRLKGEEYPPRDPPEVSTLVSPGTVGGGASI